MARLHPVDLGRDLGGAPVPRVALLRDVALGAQLLGEPCLLEERAALDERGLGLCALLARDAERVAVRLEPQEPVLAGPEARLCALHRVLGDPEASRVLGPLRREAADGDVELLLRLRGAAVAAGDRGLEPVAQGGVVLRDVDRPVVDRRRRRVERFGGHAGDRPPSRSSASAGSVVSSPSSPSRTVPFAPRNDLGERARPDADRPVVALLVVLEVERDRRRVVGRQAPRADGIDVGGCRGHLPIQRELDGPRDRGLPGFVGPAHDREARRECDVEVAMAPDTMDAQREDPHSVTSVPTRR